MGSSDQTLTIHTSGLRRPDEDVAVAELRALAQRAEIASQRL